MQSASIFSATLTQPYAFKRQQGLRLPAVLGCCLADWLTLSAAATFAGPLSSMNAGILCTPLPRTTAGTTGILVQADAKSSLA